MRARAPAAGVVRTMRLLLRDADLRIRTGNVQQSKDHARLACAHNKTTASTLDSAGSDLELGFVLADAAKQAIRGKTIVR